MKLSLAQLIAMKFTRFDEVAEQVRAASNKERAFMHAAALVECMNDMNDLASLDLDGKFIDKIERVQTKFERIIRDTPALNNKLGLLCPRMVTPPVGITIFRVPLGPAERHPMPEAHNKVRGRRLQIYLTSAQSLRNVFTLARDDNFAPGILDFLDTLNRNPDEREMVLLELNGHDGTLMFGDIQNFQVFALDQHLNPWMNYVGRSSIREGTIGNPAATLCGIMVGSETFSNMTTCTGETIFAPVGPYLTGHRDVFVDTCPPAPRKTRRRLAENEDE
jgi:hypothetical protein